MILHSLRHPLCFLLLCCLALLVSCAGTDVQSSFDRTANFQVYRTYGWYLPDEAAMAQSDRSRYSTNMDATLKTAVESELVKRGLAPADETPDLLIAYDIALPAEPGVVATAPFQTGYSFWYGYRYNYGLTGIPAAPSVEQYAAGTLLVDLVDATTNELVWRGTVAAEIDPAQLDEAKIFRAVRSAMAPFPPNTIGQ